MKQILLLMAAMLLCCCSSDSEVKAEVPTNAGKTLVVYYSYTGNCREIVNTLRSQITADVLEIQPARDAALVEPDGCHHADVPVQLWPADGWKACRTDCFKCQQWYLTSGG